jgi:hypothetical protein
MLKTSNKKLDFQFINNIRQSPQRTKRRGCLKTNSKTTLDSSIEENIQLGIPMHETLESSVVGLRMSLIQIEGSY